MAAAKQIRVVIGLTMADLAGGHWPQRARDASSANDASPGDDPTEGLMLLWECQAIFNRLRIDPIFTSELLAELSKSGLFDWAGGRLITASLRLRNTLIKYGVHPPMDQRRGTERGKGYLRENFTKAWTRYPKPPEPPPEPPEPAPLASPASGQSGD
jgi:Protein of unknown function (DUF3631)